MISAAFSNHPSSSSSSSSKRLQYARENANHKKQSRPARIVYATRLGEAPADIKINMKSAPIGLVPGSDIIIFDLKKPLNRPTNQ